MTRLRIRQLLGSVSFAAIAVGLAANVAYADEITSDTTDYSNAATLDELVISAEVSRTNPDAAVANLGTITGALKVTSTGSILSEGADNTNVYGIYNGGSIGSIVNDGSIAALMPNDDTTPVFGIYISNDATIGDITNNGTITAGIFDSDGNAKKNAVGIGIDSDVTNLINTGTIKASMGIAMSGSASLVSNSGDVTGISMAGGGFDTVGEFTNSGTITAGNSSLFDSGLLVILTTITDFTNTGAIDGGTGLGTAFLSADFGSFSNGGTIKGMFGMMSADFLGSRSTFGDFTNTATGEITGTEIGLFAGKTDFTEFTNDGVISATGDGALMALIASNVNVTAPSGIAGLQGNAAIVSLNSTFGTFTNNSSVSSTSNGTAAGLLSVGTSFDSITNAEGASISAEGTSVVLGSALVGGSAGEISNAGTMSATATASGSLSVGLLATGPALMGIEGDAVDIGTLDNSGSVTAKGDIAFGAVFDLASIDSFDNSGTVSAEGNTLGGGLLVASVDLGSFNNSGTIAGTGAYSGGVVLTGLSAMVGNLGDTGIGDLLGGIDNPMLGVITGLGSLDPAELATPMSVTSFTNSGTISGGLLGLYVGDATLGTLNNSGTISSGSVALYLDDGADVDGIDNSGTISGPDAMAFYGEVSFGTIANSGTIAGDIKNRTDHTLTFIGGTGDAYGLITGYSADPSKLVTGLIDSRDADVVFQSGNTRLNSDIDVGTHSVTNNGNLRVDSQVSITGNYTQSSSGKLVIAATAEEIGKLMVSGTADLTNGTIVIVPIGGYKLAGGVPDVLSAGTLNIDELTMRAGTDTITFSLVVIDGVTQLVANLPDNGPTSDYAEIGGDAGAVGAEMGRALDVIASGSTEAAIDFQTNVLVPLLGLDDAEQPAAIAALGPSGAPAAWQLGHNASSLFSGAVFTRQQGRIARVQAAPSPVSGYAESPAQPFASAWQNALATPGSAADPFATSVWAEALGGTGTDDDQSLSGGGLAIGADRAVSADLVLGVAGSLVSVDGETGAGDGATSTESRYQGMLYASWQPGAFHLDLQAGAGFGAVSQDRRIDFLDSVASATFDERGVTASAEAGYDLALGAATLTPHLGLDYGRSFTDGYTETGAGAANLSIDAADIASLTGRLGAKLAWALPTAFGQLTPALEAEWQHDFIDDAVVTTGSLAGTDFSVSEDRPAADAAKLGVSLGLETGNVLFGAEYYETLSASSRSQTGLLKGQVRF
jgi:uncharacterized protein with beta-barrel porin domain